MSASTPSLTRNQRMVFETLEAAQVPLTAYAILEQRHADGLRAPPQVYRALEKLLALGLVHRLDSLNAFIACRHPACAPHRVTAFAICDQCHAVTEVQDHAFSRQLHEIAQAAALTPTQSTVEIHGCCLDCQTIAAD